MVQVVSWVPDDHALEQSGIFSKDVVRPRPDLSSMPPHAPFATILQPRITLWEEVPVHVFYPRCLNLVRYGLALGYAFWLRNICIEVKCHQELGPVRSIPDGSSDILYGRGVSGGDISPYDMPPPPPCHQLKSDDIQAVEVDLFDRKVLHLAVKNSNSATVSAWCLRHHHPKSARFPRVKSFCEIRFLKTPQSTLPCSIP